MKGPRIKKHLALPLIAACLFALTLYLISLFGPNISYAEQRSAYTVHGWVLTLTEVALGISLAFLLVRILGGFVFFLFRKRKGYEAPSLIRDIFSLVAYAIIIALLLKHSFPNLSLSALLPTSALLGVILGLALQDTLGNLFAGISLHADKPFQVGDCITVGKYTGVVESITWRAAKIRTFSNHIILVSNSSIAKESIEVCPRDNLNARIVFFNALYTDSPVKVIHVVREAVREAENVSQEITPVVRIRNLGDSSVEYEVKYWLENYARYNDTDALVRQRIWYAYRRAGLTFAYPTQTLYLERQKSVSTPVNGTGLTERLSAVDIFAPLSAEELRRLASESESHVYAPGEIIIRAGDEGSSMFVVHRGRVDVQIADNGRPHTVATLQEGDFFGEMALFTGEPRTASIVAAEETEVLEIGHEAMKHLFDTDPDLVESLSHTIAERRAVLVAKAAATKDEEEESEGILNSIKRFFGLD